ncbi:MAG TPA: hypothetical protein VMV05_08845 [bacterium]|nr:hypothetical protein [bacterium]
MKLHALWVSLILTASILAISCSGNNPTAPQPTTTPVPPTATNTPCGYPGTLCTATNTSTNTSTSTPTSTFTLTATSTSTPTATNSATSTNTGTPTDTATVTPTFTPTGTPTDTPTMTPTPPYLYSTSFSVPAAISVAVNSAGTTVFVEEGNQLETYTSSGSPAGSWGSGCSSPYSCTPGTFDGAIGVAANSAGTTTYVSDTYGAKIQVGTASAYVTNFATQYGGSGYPGPWGVAVNALGTTIFSADEEYQILEVHSFDGSNAGLVTSTYINANVFPMGVACNSAGSTVFVAGEGSGIIYAYSFDSTNLSPVTQWGSSGSGDGQFTYPRGIACNSAGTTVAVADSGNNRIQVFSFISGTPTLLGQFGGGCSVAPCGAGQVLNPYGIAMDGSGNIWVADTGDQRIEEFIP